jgi:hypothetical protein
VTALKWDQSGDRLYETGVSKGVLYPVQSDGSYSLGVAWNGLTTVTETPAGAGSNKQYADDIAYLNLLSAETFGGTIEAFTYPDEFGQCDGSAEPTPGVLFGQQGRKTFGLCFRTKVGNDVDGTDHGYKLHLWYGCLAAPSQKAYASVNDQPSAINFNWTVDTTPVPVGTVDGVDYKPLSLIVVDSTKVDSAALAALETQLYGDDSGTQANLPTPAEVVGLFSGSVTVVNMNVSANKPTYDSGTHVVTLPAVTGVQWKVNGVNKSAGAQPALTTGQTADVKATPQTGYEVTGDTEYTFAY